MKEPFRIIMSRELGRPFLPDSTIDVPRMNPFINHIFDALWANVPRAIEPDDMVWAVIPNEELTGAN